MQSAVCVGKVVVMSRTVLSWEPSLVEAAITRRGRWGQWQGRGSGPTPPTATYSISPGGTGVKTGLLTAFQKAIICPLENKALILTPVFQTEHDIYTALDKACKHKYNKKPQ